MPYQIQLRRGTTAQNTAFTGAIGELTVDTQLNIVRVQDGSTAGGWPLVGTSSTQTLTNKTLSAPVITGGLTVDSITASNTLSLSNTTATHTISSQTISTTSGTGALVVTGGQGIGGNLNVGGNASITGSLTVGGVNLKTLAIVMGAALS
jgi:hypothetical protein